MQTWGHPATPVSVDTGRAKLATNAASAYMCIIVHASIGI